MSHRLGRLHAFLSRWAFELVQVDPKLVEHVRDLARRGTIVYVMRHRSVADYLFVNSVLARENLPLPQFANGVSIGWFRSLRWILGRIVERVRALDFFGGSRREANDRELARRLVGAGEPILLFLRARAAWLDFFRPERAAERNRIGDRHLADVLRAAREGGREIFVVPLAPLRGRGYRRRDARMATLVYSAREAPGDAKKLVTFLFNRGELTLRIGEGIGLRGFLEKYAAEGEEKMVRRLVRVLRVFLYREERVVWGPPLLPKHAARRLVVGSPEVDETIARLAAERNVAPERVRREAGAMFDEIAANFNGTYFSILAFAFRRIWNRMFRGIEISGLDGVADRIREHPVVLVPCHRSHFDYLILSYIFHGHFLSPPHIAAGINLSFFPMGMLFRGAGAYFIRRTFGDDPLYKAVFRQYLTYLIREGYTQEFFIEGGRSRTGKILTPKLGMLSVIVDAFLRGVRRDLYFVPVSISYERLVEEEAYKRELLGAEKEPETLGALFRARGVLRTNYGKVYVSFAEPISLNDALGSLKDRFREAPEDPAVEEEKRRFVLKFGFRLLGGVNEASVLGAPSVAATALLASPHPALRHPDFVRASNLLLEHAERQHARLTAPLLRDRQDFRETVGFLESSGAVARISADGDEGILYVPDDKRINLDFYKNNGIHLYVVVSLLAEALVRGVPRERLREELWFWLDLFRNEFVLPERETLAAEIGDLLERLHEIQVVRDSGVDTAHPFLRLAAPILQNFREAYWVAARALVRLPELGIAEKALVEEMRRIYRANLLLGVLRKPEGNTTVTLGNAVVRFGELGFTTVERRGRNGRDRWVMPGPARDGIGTLERRLGESVMFASTHG
ncbi:MAG: glycerol-3-phosphate O-acyltransferase [Candidatus Binatota bacterium]|nr:glycerol-3-phosphate O-acyltransferase [Candidatus Binatota bacterium]